MNQALAIMLIVLGVVLLLANKLPWVGHLPGDFVWQGKHWTMSFPLMTCLIVSLIVTVIIRWFGKN